MERLPILKITLYTARIQKTFIVNRLETILEMMEKAQERYERQETLNNKPEQPKPSISKKPTRKGPKL